MGGLTPFFTYVKNNPIYVKNNPINKKDPSGKIALPFLGLPSLISPPGKRRCETSCERDFALMEKTFQESLQFMNNNYNRSFAIINGSMGTIAGNSQTNRPSCFDQAVFLQGRLRNNSYENSDWNFNLDYSGFDLSEGTFGTFGGPYHFHTWVVAHSPACGSRTFDPWFGYSGNLIPNLLV